MDLSKISDITLERYNKRYNDLGKHIRTLGWGSEEQQEYRFLQTLEAFQPEESSILDIGCGFGDFRMFLEKNQLTYKHYTGWDINANFVEEGKKSATAENIDFKTVDIALDDIQAYENSFDAAIMLGLLNYNLKAEETNYAFSKKLIANAFKLVKNVLVVDFLSTNLSKDYPKEDFVFYHDPAKMIEFAAELSDNFVLKHNFSPIPQKEFLLFIYK